MEQLERAIDLEAKKQVVTAAELYETILSERNKPPLDVFLNLIMIYFTSLDPGYQREYELTDAFVENGGNRLLELFPEAQRLYPDSVELAFWHNLVFSIHKCDPWGPSYDDIDPKFSKQTDTLYPYYLFYRLKKNLFKNQAAQLWEIVKEGRTCKDRYVRSTLAPYFDQTVKEFPKIDRVVTDKNGEILKVILKKSES